MKKGLLFTLILLLGLGFVACQDVSTEETTTQGSTTEQTTQEITTTEQETTTELTTVDNVAPVISGADDLTIYLNEDFNPLDGVTATDNIDGDITASITYVGVVDNTQTGVYYLRYSVSDTAGNTTEEARYITVEVDPDLIGDALIQNGDFSLGNAIWNLNSGAAEGGNGTFDVVDGVGVVEVIVPTGSAWGPRLESNLIEFENGVTYEVSFDAKALAARSVHVQVGELLACTLVHRFHAIPRFRIRFGNRLADFHIQVHNDFGYQCQWTIVV